MASLVLGESNVSSFLSSVSSSRFRTASGRFMIAGVEDESSFTSLGSCSSRFAALLGCTHVVTVVGGSEAITTLVMTEVTVVTPPPGVVVIQTTLPDEVLVGVGMGVRPGIRMLDRCGRSIVDGLGRREGRLRKPCQKPGVFLSCVGVEALWVTVAALLCGKARARMTIQSTNASILLCIVVVGVCSTDLIECGRFKKLLW